MRTNIKRTLISLVTCGTCLALVKFKILGIVGMMLVVASLLLTVIYGGLAIAGRDDDAFDAYQEGKRTAAKSLVAFFRRKDA